MAQSNTIIYFHKIFINAGAPDLEHLLPFFDKFPFIFCRVNSYLTQSLKIYDSGIYNDFRYVIYSDGTCEEFAIIDVTPQQGESSTTRNLPIYIDISKPHVVLANVSQYNGNTNIYVGYTSMTNSQFTAYIQNTSSTGANIKLKIYIRGFKEN